MLLPRQTPKEFMMKGELPDGQVIGLERIETAYHIETVTVRCLDPCVCG